MGSSLLRLTVNILAFLRLTVNFLAFLRLTVIFFFHYGYHPHSGPFAIRILSSSFSNCIFLSAIRCHPVHTLH